MLRDMTNIKKLSNKEVIKVKELVKLLEANEKYLSALGKNEKALKIVKDLRTALKPFCNVSYEKMLEILGQSLRKVEEIQKEIPNVLIEGVAVEQIPFNQLKLLLSEEKLDKKQLLLIAEKRLGIPVGNLKKMRKALVLQKILNTIKNIEKLDTIEKKAAE